MSAGVYDFTIEQGVPYTFQIHYQNPDKSPKNLTGWTGKGQIKTSISDCEPLGEFLIEFTEPEIGKLKLTVPTSVTDKVKIKGTRYTDYSLLVYDVKIWLPSNPNEIVRLLNGVIKVSPAVTIISVESP